MEAVTDKYEQVSCYNISYYIVIIAANSIDHDGFCCVINLYVHQMMPGKLYVVVFASAFRVVNMECLAIGSCTC